MRRSKLFLQQRSRLLCDDSGNAVLSGKGLLCRKESQKRHFRSNAPSDKTLAATALSDQIESDKRVG
jgi:hypothetical protein